MSETKQQGFSKSLRALADWYDQHPQTPVPALSLAVHVDVKDWPQVPKEARLDLYFSASGGGLYRQFLERDGYTVQFYAGLEQIAEKKVVGQKTQDVIEWVIKPAFADVPGPVAASEGEIEG